MIETLKRTGLSKKESPISFRLTDEEIALLDAEAERRGLSRSETARELVRELLAGKAAPLEDEVRKLRRQLAKQDEGNGSVMARIDEMFGELLAAIGEIKATRDVPPDISTGRDRLTLLREDLATAVCGLLVHAGRTTKEDAEKWVTAHLLSERG